MRTCCHSAALGAQLAALLDPDTPIAGITEGEPRPALRAIAVPTTAPARARLAPLRGLGQPHQQGIAMPGRGRIETRGYTPDDVVTGSRDRRCRTMIVAAISGPRSGRAGSRIGGYQVIKKWLSYRDHVIIDRALTAEEVAHIQHTARRLAVLCCWIELRGAAGTRIAVCLSAASFAAGVDSEPGWHQRAVMGIMVPLIAADPHGAAATSTWRSDRWAWRPASARCPYVGGRLGR